MSNAAPAASPDAPSSSADRFADLRSGVRGEVITAGAPAYDEARRVFNSAIDRRPVAIVRCRGTADVVHAVNFARTQRLALSVRGGGHNVAGQAIVEGGVVVDLSAMRSVWVDPKGRRVRVQGGATWADVDRETQLFGLATPGGLVSGTGVAGFTLGGGIGWLVREFGLACDNLVGAEVVLATGSVLHVTETEHPELLWALRGGGGNFGVVTSFEFLLHEVGPVVYGGGLFYERDGADRRLAALAEFVKSAPEKLTTLVVLANAPPAPFLPAYLHGKPIMALAFCYDGATSDGEAALAPLKTALGPPVADLSGPLPFTALQSMFDATAPHGRRHYWKSLMFDELGEEHIGALLEQSARAPSPLTEIHIHQMGGAVRREPRGGSSFAHRDPSFIVNLVSQWIEPADDRRCTDWARQAWEALRPLSTGHVYVNFLTDTNANAVAPAYSTQALSRLAQVKDRYDPENLFRATHAIPARAR